MSLVNIGGKRVIRGGNNICNGPVMGDALVLNTIITKLVMGGFKNVQQESVLTRGLKRTANDDVLTPSTVLLRTSDYEGLEVRRPMYARMYGPTTGDVVRLGDTDLFVRVERDCTVYGDE